MACPVCDGETDRDYRPFRSRRCADLDLGKWFNGSYSITSDEIDDTGPASGAAPDLTPKLH